MNLKRMRDQIKVGHVNTLSIKKNQGEKEIEETGESYRWRFI